MNTEITTSANNPFLSVSENAGSLEMNHSANVAVEGQRAMAEIQAAVFMAKQFPRDAVRAYDNIMRACERPGLAATAMYEYARGGSPIQGPSIRLAEAIANEWGNVQYGFIELESTPYRTVAQAFAWNLESNLKVIRNVTIPHERHTKKGKVRLTDPRDIYELVANQMQRRVRACILEVIPGDVVEDAIAKCKATLLAKADTSPEGVLKLTQVFMEFGVSRTMIEKFIQRKIEAITPGNVVRLRSIYQSLRDGVASVTDFFELEEPEEAPAQSKKVAGMKKQLTKATSPEEQAEQKENVFDVLGEN